MEACLLSQQKEIVDVAATAMIQNTGTGLQHTSNYLNVQSFYSRTKPIHKLMYKLARISCLRYDGNEIPE